MNWDFSSGDHCRHDRNDPTDNVIQVYLFLNYL